MAGRKSKFRRKRERQRARAKAALVADRKMRGTNALIRMAASLPAPGEGVLAELSKQ
jgi:hypothetical protein